MDKSLAEVARDYYINPTSKNYIELRNYIFELERVNIIEEIITEKDKQTNSDIAIGMSIAKDIVKNYMKQDF